MKECEEKVLKIFIDMFNENKKPFKISNLSQLIPDSCIADMESEEFIKIVDEFRLYLESRDYLIKFYKNNNNGEFHRWTPPGSSYWIVHELDIPTDKVVKSNLRWVIPPILSK